MATVSLDLVIGVVDKASGPLGRIGGALGGLAKIGGAAFLGGAVAGIGALGAALAGGIGDAREAALVMAQTEAVIKSTGGAAGFSAEQISEMAASLSAASGKSLFGDDDIQKGQNMLLTFTNIKETLPDATSIMLDMATAMGTDAGGAAVQLGKALNDPVAGISALSRVGVTFSEEQKAVIATLMETGDVAGAQRVILAELNKEFGGSAAAAAAADGGMAQFKDSMGELAESVGAQVLPALNSLMAWLNSPDVKAGIEAFVTGLVTGFKAFLEWFSINVMPTLKVVFDWLSNTALPAVQSAFEVAWPIIKTAVAATWDWLQTTVFPNAKIMFGELMETVDLVRDTFVDNWPKIKTAIGAVYDFIMNVVWPGLQIQWQNLMRWQDDAQAKFEIVWPIIKTAIKTVFDWITQTFIPGVQTAFNNLKTWIGEVKTRWDTDINSIKTFVQGLQDKVTTVKDAIGIAIATLKGFFTDGWETVKSTIKGVFDTIGGYISGPIETAKNAVNTAIGIITGAINGAINLVNGLIGLINSIPGVPNLPSIPGMNMRSIGGRVPYGPTGYIPDLGRPPPRDLGRALPDLGGGFPGGGGSIAMPGAGMVVNIDARNATDPRAVQDAVDRAFRKTGIAADLRLRTT